VASLKIEGRKKNALYVAAAVSYYRDLLDGRLDAKDRPAREADLQTIFSRPWTRLFVQSHRDKEVADRDTSGHRGTRIGTVEQIVPDGRGGRWLRFTTSRRLEVRDGIQVDLPDLRQPFGCAIEELRILPAGRGATAQRVFEAPAGARVEIMLPPNHAVLPAGAPVYCSSSQAVKQAHKVARPRPGQYHARRVTDFELRVAAEELKVIARTALVGGNGAAIEATVVVPGTFPAAKDAARLEAAARGAFEKLGSSAFALGAFRLVNPDSRFIPLSILNEARRACVATLEQRVAEARGARLGEVRAACLTEGGDSPKAAPAAARWSLKVDRLAFLDGFEERDWADVDEVLVEIAREPLARLEQGVARVGAAVGRERVRLALPALTRKWEEADIRRKVTALREAGWRKWEAANIAAWRLLDLNAPSPYPLPPRERGNNGPSSGVLPQGERVADLATDWSVYVVNHLAAQQVLAMGATRFALSPEDGLENVRALVSQFGARATVIVYQDTPQFLAESCAYANLIGGCPGKGNCLFENMALESDDGERLLALDYRCRTIVVNQQPYCIAPYGKELAAAGAVSLRADFVYRPYAPEDVRRVWRLLRAGESVPGTQAACFARGMT
jgi:putative protease